MSRRDVTAAPRRRRLGMVGVLVAALALSLSGCAESAARGFLPHGVTENSQTVIALWNNSWIAALGVGVIVWGLTLWCVFAFRRKKTDTGLPEQLRYNVPIEILYTVVPLFMIAVLFFYTARDETTLLDTSQEPDVTINVVGKQWSWDFNYVDQNVYEAGTQAELTGKPGVEETLPTLYLPVNQRVEFVLTARDVIHSFWVPQFLQKLDMLPGRVNKFQIVGTETGTFAGKCAELCGAYHSQMLFNVAIVSRAEFDKHIASLRAAGNVGQLPNSLNREPIMPDAESSLPATDRGNN